MQDSNAEYVASKTTYNKMGYSVNKSDSEGIKIFMPNFYNIAKITDENGNISFRPYFALTQEEKEIYKDKKDNRIVFYKQKLSGFNLGNVFNIIDTDMPINVINEELNPILENSNADDITDIFIKAIYRDDFKIEYKELSSGEKGYYDLGEKKIVLKKGLSNLMRLKVLVHEYAHALAHQHLKGNNKEYQINRNQYETEAESIAYVVTKYLGLDTSHYSTMYLYSWSKDKDFNEIENSLSVIVNTSKRIINNYNKMYEKSINMEKEIVNI